MSAEVQPRDHWVPSTGGHELHVQELEPPGEANGAAVLCIHGVFSDSRFYYNAKQQGAGRYFTDQGYRVFLGNLRGHGRSRWPEGGPKKWGWSFDDYAEADVPALIRFAAAKHTGPLFAFAHSFGGYTLLAALGVEPALQNHLAGVAVLAAAVNDYTDGGLLKRIQLPLSSTIASVVGRLPGKRLGLGPSDEPPALMRQFAQWAARGTFCSVDGSRDYWQALRAVELPVYAGIGATDVFHASPARARKLVDHLSSKDVTFQVYGRAHGIDHDFGHFDIAAGKRAAEVVLPRVHSWMKEKLP